MARIVRIPEELFLAHPELWTREGLEAYLRQHGIRITIPRKQNEHRTGPFNRLLYRQRERVEWLINRLKHHRRLATRYEKCALNYHAMWLIAATLLWL